MLLISLNLTSLWRWWIKAAAIIVTTIFFGVTYSTINALMGWPTTQRPPGRFNLISSRILEPDRRTRAPGHIYLWADELDRNNIPSGTPRSYELPYSDALARKVSDAQEKRDRGIDIMGRTLDPKQQQQLTKNASQGGRRNSKDKQSPATDTVPFKEDGSDLSFEDLPPVLLPDKGPL
ncbi:hypothetical protein [Rhodopila globiformis]|uniref:hypothetical protein n=1 Tax=Rhodopila globiformis TaxID=1071 RepID=UPI0011B0DC71|nr:hypothetical protein [Rhodopila globiformis]